MSKMIEMIPTWTRTGPREHLVMFDRRTQAERERDALWDRAMSQVAAANMAAIKWQLAAQSQASDADIARFNGLLQAEWAGLTALPTVAGSMPMPVSWLGIC